MPDREPHCPFLNRSDARCGNHLSLNHLGSAFDHCFGCYAGCATYQEMLAERRARREQGHRSGTMSYAIPDEYIPVRLPDGHAAAVSAA